MQLEGLTRLVALKKYQLNTSCRAEKLPNEHNSFSQCCFKFEKVLIRVFGYHFEKAAI